MLLNKLNHSKQKTKQKEQSTNKVLKGKTTVWAQIQKKNKKMSIRYTVRVGPFVKSL